MSVIITGMDMPKRCSDCPICIYSAEEKNYIGYCNTSDDDYYCKALDRFMEYDIVDGGVDILGKPKDCPLKSVEWLIKEIKNIDLDKTTNDFYGMQKKVIEVIKEYFGEDQE